MEAKLMKARRPRRGMDVRGFRVPFRRERYARTGFEPPWRTGWRTVASSRKVLVALLVAAAAGVAALMRRRGRRALEPTGEAAVEPPPTTAPSADVEAPGEAPARAVDSEVEH